jgi:hypothetical protein
MDIVMLKPEDNSLGKLSAVGIIFVLAGLLIFYHSSLLIDFYILTALPEPNWYIHLQSITRAIIVISLVGVIAGKNTFLLGMWGGIASLTLTRYGLLFVNETFDSVPTTELLGYLRGFIFPTIITICYPKKSKLTARKEGFA